MAQANPTALADFSGFINPDRAQAYFEEARKRSVVQQLVRQLKLAVAEDRGNGRGHMQPAF